MLSRRGSLSCAITVSTGFLSVMGGTVQLHADCIGDLVEQVSKTNIAAHIKALAFPRDDPVSQAVASAYAVAFVIVYNEQAAGWGLEGRGPVCSLGTAAGCLVSKQG